MKIKIEVQDAELQQGLQALIETGLDLTPVMADIGEALLNSTRQRFSDQVSPDGVAWSPLSQFTSAACSRRGSTTYIPVGEGQEKEKQGQDPHRRRPPAPLAFRSGRQGLRRGRQHPHLRRHSPVRRQTRGLRHNQEGRPHPLGRYPGPAVPGGLGQRQKNHPGNHPEAPQKISSIRPFPPFEYINSCLISRILPENPAQLRGMFRISLALSKAC